MPGPEMPNAGNNAPIVKVGHTTGTKYGTNPLEKERGPSNPQPITFGGGNSR